MRRLITTAAAVTVLFAVTIPASAQATGSISGTITDEATGAPVCATVLVYDLAGTLVDSVRPDAGGAYTVALPAGDYKVQFEDNCGFIYVSEWYDNQPDLASATPVTITAGADTPGISAALALPADTGGWISGRVTESVSGLPVPGICAVAIDAGGQVIPTMTPTTSSPRTNADGRYRLAELGTQTVRLLFTDCSLFIFQDVYWNNKADLASADPISVVDGEEVFNVDAIVTLVEGATFPPETTVPPTTAPPTTVATGVLSGTLPVTGTELGSPAILGAIVIVAGAMLLLLVERRH